MESNSQKWYTDLMYNSLFYAEDKIFQKELNKDLYEEYREILTYIEHQLENVPNRLKDICKLIKHNFKDMRSLKYINKLWQEEFEALEKLDYIIAFGGNIETDKNEVIKEVKKRRSKYDGLYI